jgi:VRR-NUC domain
VSTLRMRNPKPPVPDEVWEQKTFVAKCRQESATWPALSLLMLVANGARMPGRYYTNRRGERVRYCLEGQEQIDLGLLYGAPDLFLPVCAQGSSGLWIEMKRLGEKATVEQESLHARLREQGYAVVVAQGHAAAWEAVKAYLEIEP